MYTMLNDSIECLCSCAPIPGEGEGAPRIRTVFILKTEFVLIARRKRYTCGENHLLRNARTQPSGRNYNLLPVLYSIWFYTQKRCFSRFHIRKIVIYEEPNNKRIAHT